MGHSSSKGRRRACGRVHRGVAVERTERDASGTIGLDTPLEASLDVLLDGVPDDVLDDMLVDTLDEGSLPVAVGLRTFCASLRPKRGGCGTIGLDVSLDE